jgi:hypothetical protein
MEKEKGDSKNDCGGEDFVQTEASKSHCHSLNTYLLSFDNSDSLK